MQIEVLLIGKTDSPQVEALTAEYLRRLGFYAKVVWSEIPDPKTHKKTTPAERQRLDEELLLKRIQPSDYVVLLDERGAEMNSVAFARWMDQRLQSGARRLCFVIGGPYGFTQTIYDRANAKLSLSQMTFSHQIIRPLFAEQLYRAFTILKGEPYHHQ